MRKRSLLAFGLVVLAVVGLTGCGRPEEKPAAASETPATAAVTPSGGERDDSGAEQILADVRELQQKLRSARRVLREVKRQKASLELSQIADALSQDAGMVSGDVKEDLQFSANEVVGLAERLYSTSNITIDDIDPVYTRIFWSLAAFHHQMAAKQWADADAEEMIAHLKATTIYLEEANGYQNAGYDEEIGNLINVINGFVEELESKANLGADAVSVRLEETGKELQQISRQVRSMLS